MVVVESLTSSEYLNDIKYVYCYHMIKSSLNLAYGDDNLRIQTQSYGIEVERQSIDGESIVAVERDCIKNISTERHKVHNLLKLLCDNKVSPIHLVDVIGSYADEYASDYDMLVNKTAMI